MTKDELWQAVLAQIQLKISKANFATWFSNTRISQKEKGKVIVSVPNSFAKEWLEAKYHKFILKILRNLDQKIKQVEYTVSQNKGKTKDSELGTVTLEDTDQLEFQEFKVNKDTGLNPRYSFANFVVGPFNELTHAAAWAVSKKPGSVYNPLFIYGGVGLGKTHLLQAIGNKVVESFPKKKTKYIPSANFTSGIVTSIKNHNIEKFKKKYQQVDTLIIDDIQFLAGKEKTQEEFFHIFNALYESNKQIVISSDRLPQAIPALEERLKSRFEGGMIADISLPDYETRLAILKSKAKEKGVEIPEEVLDYVASNIQKNIRELEGALNRLIIYQKVNQKNPNLEIVKKLLQKIIHSPPKVTRPQSIIRAVVDFYNLKEEELKASSRKKEIVRPRQIAMYLLREELEASYPFIGKKLGGRDHTTAIYAFEKIQSQLEKDESLAEEIKLIKQRIYSG